MSNHYTSAIRVANYGDADFHGWISTVTDRWQSHEPVPQFLLRANEAQAFEDADPKTRTPRFSLIVATGRRFGTNRTEIGVWTSVAPGQMIVQHWDHLVPASPAAAESLLGEGETASLHWRSLDDWQQYLEQQGLKFDTLRFNGAFIDCHAQEYNAARGERREIWARFDPHTPELLFCETLVVAVGKPARVQAAPEITNWHRVAMRGPEGLVDLADGQGVATSFTLVNMPFHAALLANKAMGIVHSNRVRASGQIIAHATERMYGPRGSSGPGWPKELTPEQCIEWMNQHISVEQKAIEQMHTVGKLGPAQDMARKGAQEDQFFLGSELRLPGCEIPREMAAWGFARYPCQILNLHGQPIDPRLHDKLVFWMGRPHYNRNVSPDQLGRSRWPAATESHGWTNPCDEEHWLINNLWVATMLRNSPVHQRLLEYQARAWLLSCTTDPRLATTRPGAARAVGYKCWVAWLLWHGLQDRDLAEQVVSHASKWLDVIVPMIRQRTQDGWWDVRVNVPSLGAGRWVMPWQQALGAYGLWRLGALVGHQEAINTAHAGALVVVNSAYWLVEGRWRALYSMCLDDNRRDDKDDYSDFGCPLALPVIGADRPESAHHQKWLQSVKYGSGRWTCPMTDRPEEV